MRYKKRIVHSAHRDIAGIKSYIEKDKPSAAVKVANGIYDLFYTLVANPQMGAALKDKFGIETDFNFFVKKPYIILYKIEGEFLSIYRVLDGRSDYLTQLGFDK
jgi:plasmid stabilization system protein ParE